ncbi:MAG: maltose alpha-D-glucosyltransferase [Chloroflexi bacterium]|nr:maltose alpha-D-glucosyltransferase [Chloroflexota bacterium]
MAIQETSFPFRDDPLWYKDAIIYELHVRSFYDSDGDGIGDFRGLTEKLEYLQDLGVTALWLLPFYPSPLKDDGYDIANYTDVHPSYGTLHDFTDFLRQAHQRGIRVVTELVLNHTSDHHPWFQRARRAKPGSRWRNLYVWSDNPQKYQEARIIFKDFESSNWAFDPEVRAYYWHRFYTHQPDLNYDNPYTRQAMLRVMDFWLRLGVSGLRLDAVPYLYEREGTDCENLPQTHAFLKELRRHVDQRFNNRMLLAEANQWPDDAVAYLGEGDESHMAFHFPLMPRIFMAIRMEDRFPILDILAQTPPIPETCQWALFLRNHDELTLEMVTDEDRDYMYRVYASDPQARLNLGIRRRLAPLLGNHRRRMELVNGILFSLPGTPVLYYGDEIGMGDNIYLGDRNGVRTPMQWSANRNAGFSQANPQRLYLPVIIDPEYHYEALNVEIQQNNPHSLLWWVKRLIFLRKRFKAFGRGTLEFLHPSNRRVLAFLRKYQDECILVVANLSRFVQYLELDMSLFKGMTPVEIFSQTRFPTIGELPYLLTLGPHDFYWFAIQPQGSPSSMAGSEAPVPTVTVTGPWQNAFHDAAKESLEVALPSYLKGRRWFQRKAFTIRSTEITEVIPITREADGLRTYLTLVKVEYGEGEPETYLMPLALASGDRADEALRKWPQEIVAHLEDRDEGKAVLYDALLEKGFCQALLEAIARRRRSKGSLGSVLAWPARGGGFRRRYSSGGTPLKPSILKAEQTNTSVIYGDRFILKLFRRLDVGINPDLEMGRFLTQKASFLYSPPVAGALEYHRDHEEPLTLAILHGFAPNEGDAWQYTLHALSDYFERVLAHPQVLAPPALPESLLAGSDQAPLAQETVGPYLEWVRLLGQRTAQLHLALASDAADPGFAPEPFSANYQHSLFHAMRGLAVQNLELLRQSLVPEGSREYAQRVLALEDTLIGRFQAFRQQKFSAMRIRCHGDYHLGQVLYTGKDFAIIDFEGEPARPLSERRLKRSPLKDVAGMIRSFHYAVCAALSVQSLPSLRPEDLPVLEPWAQQWYFWVSATFLGAYLATMKNASLLPQNPEELKVLLEAYLLEKAVYEMGYELNNRPSWIRVPLEGILQLLENRR